MDTNISTKTLILSCAVIVAVETAAVMAISKTGIPSMVLTGIVRLVDMALIFLILLKSKEGPGQVGLLPGQALSGLKRGMVWSCGFAVAAAILFGLISLAGHNPLLLFRTPMPHDMEGIFMIFLVGGLVAPFAEELFFRGLLFGYCRRWGFPVALVISTALFAGMHPLSTSFPLPQIVGGIVFAVAYERGKNLLVPITVHMLGNMALFTLSLIPPLL